MSRKTNTANNQPAAPGGTVSPNEVLVKLLQNGSLGQLRAQISRKVKDMKGYSDGARKLEVSAKNQKPMGKKRKRQKYENQFLEELDKVDLSCIDSSVAEVILSLESVIRERVNKAVNTLISESGETKQMHATPSKTQLHSSTQLEPTQTPKQHKPPRHPELEKVRPPGTTYTQKQRPHKSTLDTPVMHSISPPPGKPGGPLTRVSLTEVPPTEVPLTGVPQTGAPLTKVGSPQARIGSPIPRIGSTRARVRSPKVESPNAASSKSGTPLAASPNAGSPDAVSTRFAPPRFASPRVASHRASPRGTSPRGTSPSPEAGSPRGRVGSPGLRNRVSNLFQQHQREYLSNTKNPDHRKLQTNSEPRGIPPYALPGPSVNSQVSTPHNLSAPTKQPIKQEKHQIIQHPRAERKKYKTEHVRIMKSERSSGSRTRGQPRSMSNYSDQGTSATRIGKKSKIPMNVDWHVRDKGQKGEKFTDEWYISHVGHQIQVYWPMDDQYYEGRITKYVASQRKCIVLYEDGEQEHLDLQKETFEFITPNGSNSRASHSKLKKQGKRSRILHDDDSTIADRDKRNPGERSNSDESSYDDEDVYQSDDSYPLSATARTTKQSKRRHVGAIGRNRKPDHHTSVSIHAMAPAPGSAHSRDRGKRGKRKGVESLPDRDSDAIPMKTARTRFVNPEAKSKSNNPVPMGSTSDSSVPNVSISTPMVPMVIAPRSDTQPATQQRQIKCIHDCCKRVFSPTSKKSMASHMVKIHPKCDVSCSQWNNAANRGKTAVPSKKKKLKARQKRHSHSSSPKPTSFGSPGPTRPVSVSRHKSEHKRDLNSSNFSTSSPSSVLSPQTAHISSPPAPNNRSATSSSRIGSSRGAADAHSHPHAHSMLAQSLSAAHSHPHAHSAIRAADLSGASKKTANARAGLDSSESSMHQTMASLQMDSEIGDHVAVLKGGHLHDAVIAEKNDTGKLFRVVYDDPKQNPGWISKTLVHRQHPIESAIGRRGSMLTLKMDSTFHGGTIDEILQGVSDIVLKIKFPNSETKWITESRLKQCVVSSK